MKEFRVSEKIFLTQGVNAVWSTISSKNALELFQPFCLNNDVLDYKKKDKLIYLNGLTYIREFSTWEPKKGFQLNIGKEHGKKSKVIWEIGKKGEGCEIKISIFPYKTNKIPKLLYPFALLYVIKPKLKNYLRSVLKGLKYHLDHEVKIEKNQFGKHPWFS